MELRKDYLAFGTPDFTDEEIAAVTRVMRTGWVGMGPETIAFERELAAFVGAPEVVSVNSCTSALFLALLVEGIGPGDEVIVPSLTWCATANAALYLGATPVFCDVDQNHMCATPETVMSKVTNRTRAVIVVHYGGFADDMQAFRTALPPQVKIIEDAAHALGARYPNGEQVGSSGHPVCFSFYANKNVSTADGGAIALFDPDKAERLRRLRMSGFDSSAWLRFISPETALLAGVHELGYKMNFTDLQAAIGRVQLARLECMAEVRLEIARHYLDGIRNLNIEVAFQKGVLEKGHARHLMVGKFDPEVTNCTRNELLLALRARNIGASIHYQPLHTMPFYKAINSSTLPVTEKLADAIMTLPMSAKMTRTDADYVLDHLKALIDTHRARQ